jgi:dTDP-4-amino-4,6-dideoxygalactose transaminase
MAVPLLDITGQFAEQQSELETALLSVAKSGKYILGENVSSLERELANYVDAAYGIGCASGTDALILSLRAFDIGPSQEVITTPYSFFSTASVISLVGATPVFVDIDPKTFNIDVAGLEEKMSVRTKAVIAVHLYGQPAEMEALKILSDQWGVKLIEDACQAVGAEYKRKRVCSLGDTGCLSFYPTKNLSGMGDGGMAFTTDKAVAKKLVMLREHGSEKRYEHRMIGYNSRLDELQAVVLRIRLKKLDEWTEKRRLNARIYNELFMGSDVETPFELPYVRHVYNQYVVRVPKRESLIKHLQTKQIGYAVYYPVPLHLQECFSHLGYKKGDMPEAERAAEETLALPIHPGLSQDQLQEVAKTILAFYR